MYIILSLYSQNPLIRQGLSYVGLWRSFYIEMLHSVDEMKCRSWNAEHDFVGLKSHL